MTQQAIEDCKEKLERYKEAVVSLKSEIESAKDSVKSSESLAKKEVEPIVKSILSLLEQRKAIQLNFNKKLQNQITDLKKEKAELVQNIIQCKKKVDELQKDLGRYPGDKSAKSKYQTKTLTGQF